MRDFRIGFIGVGNMGSALLRSLVGSGFPAQRVMCSDISEEQLRNLAVLHSVHVTRDNKALAQWADIVILVVKPVHANAVLTDISSEIDGKAVFSIVTGMKTVALRGVCPNTRVLRVVPNTPAMTGEGMTALSKGHDLTAEELVFAERLFESAGKVLWVDETLLDTATAVVGSSPAFVYMFIDALADAGVRNGLPRAQAIRLAAQTVRGAATLVLESGKHPGVLKDEVCSPAGTTIEGVFELETGGFRAAVMNAVDKSVKRAQEIGRDG